MARKRVSDDDIGTAAVWFGVSRDPWSELKVGGRLVPAPIEMTSTVVPPDLRTPIRFTASLLVGPKNAAAVERFMRRLMVPGKVYGIAHPGLALYHVSAARVENVGVLRRRGPIPGTKWLPVTFVETRRP